MADTKESPIGQPVKRRDGRAKVTGQARYAAEAPVRTAHATIVTSTIGRGQVSTLDTAAAKAAPGVLAVVTPETMPKFKGGSGMSGENRFPLSDMEVHYAGQPIAVVVAETPEQARHAASLVRVTYREEKPVIELHDPRAAVRTPSQNFGEPLQNKRGDVAKAMQAEGLTVVKATYATPVETHNPMEMGAVTAIWAGDDQVTVWNATQAVSGTRDYLASVFGLKKENVMVHCPFTGGGFGCKGSSWPYMVLALVAAKQAKRPTKLVLTRQQMFTSCGHRPPTEQTMTLAAGKDGKLAAIRHETVMHGSALNDFVESTAVGTSRVMYASPNLEEAHIVHVMDVAPPTYMRAPGESPGSFALESAMDELAVALAMDPVALRVANHSDVNPQTGQPWSTKHLKEAYALGAEKFGWARRDPRPGSMRAKDGRRMGWGMATAAYPAIKFPGTARIRLMLDATRRLRAVGAAATQDLGTGTWTIGAQVTAALVGLPLDRVQFELGDSSLPASGVSGGSATAASLSDALSVAANLLRAELLRLANLRPGSPLAGLTAKQVALRGDRLEATDDAKRGVDIADLIANSGSPFVEGASRPGGNGNLQPGEDKQDERKYAFHSFGAHFVEVLVDDPVPMVRVNRVVSVMDVGRVLNAKTAHSQVIGGVVMGVGMALLEETLYDPRTARPMTNNLADYVVPVNPDIHMLEAYFVGEPDLRFNPIGCRGVGEIGITGVAAAIANAVYHATGKRVRDLPITLDKLL